MDKRIVIVLMAFILGATMWERSGQAGAPTAALTKLTFGMPTTPPNLVHIGPWVAKEQGFFVEEGLDLEMTTFEGGIYVIRKGVKGALDAGGVAASGTIISAGKETAIKANSV